MPSIAALLSRRPWHYSDPLVFGPPIPLQRPINIGYTTDYRYCPEHDVRWHGDEPCFACPPTPLSGDRTT